MPRVPDPEAYLLYQRYRKNEANLRFNLISRKTKSDKGDPRIKNFYGRDLAEIARYHEKECGSRQERLYAFIRARKDKSLFIATTNEWIGILQAVYASDNCESEKINGVYISYYYTRDDNYQDGRRLVFCRLPLNGYLSYATLKDAACRIARERPDLVQRLVVV